MTTKSKTDDLTARARVVLDDPRMTRDIKQWLIEMGVGHAAYHGIDRRSHKTLQELGLAQAGKHCRCTKLGNEVLRLWEDEGDQ